MRTVKTRVTRVREVTITEFVDIDIRCEHEHQAENLARKLVEAQCAAGHEPNWLPSITEYMVPKPYSTTIDAEALTVDGKAVPVVAPAAPPPVPPFSPEGVEF